MADIFSARRGEQASIDALKNYVAPTLSTEQESALNDAALGIDRKAGTITDDRTGNTYDLNSAQGKNVLKYNTQNYEDVTNQPPGDAPAGTHYDWDPYNRKWTLYKDNGTPASGGGGGGGGGGNTGTTGSTTSLTDYFAKQAADTAAATATAGRQSAYDTLYNEFNKYGLGSLVEQLKGMITDAKVSPSEFAIALQNTEEYKKRFAANQDRIKQGLRALSPAEYIGLEDQYQNIMRNYGLPASYYTKDSLGTQAGLNKFIANDVSAAELEDRIATAQKRVLNSDVNVMDALKQFYPDITNGDILAYTLDPTNALENIKRKVTAAEIGGAALAQGLGTNVGRAEELAKYGITKAQAQQGYSAIGELLPTATKLGDIYANQGLGPYNQATAESEVFNTANAAEAARKRKKLTQLEQATFSGQSGTAQGALARERQGSF